MQRQLKKLFVIGDSISLHYEPYLRDFIDDYYEYDRKGELLERSVNSFDKISGDSGMLLSYLKEQAESDFSTDVLMLNCGLHDIKIYKDNGNKPKISLDEYKKNLSEIADIAKKCSKITVWVTTTHVDDEQHKKHSYSFDRYNSDVISYNQASVEIFSKNDAFIIDLNTFTCKLGKKIFCDHIHFDESIREIQGAYIGGFLAGLYHKL